MSARHSVSPSSTNRLDRPAEADDNSRMDTINTLSRCSERRRALQLRMGQGVAVIPTAPVRVRNRDSDYLYRFDSYFYYLSGFSEPESVLVLVAGQAPKSILFCRERDPARELWDGVRVGPDGADPTWDARIMDWLNEVRSQTRSGIAAPAEIRDLRTALDEMRLFKDDSEVAVMRRAAAISAAAHERAMRATRPGRGEYEIEAELLYEFRRRGSQYPAYTPIVAGGANACILHYRENSARLADG